MTLRLDDVVSQDPDAAARGIGGLHYAIDMETGDLHSFNEVGSRIWELIETRRRVAEVVDAIVEEFEIDRPTAQADTLEFLDKLHKRSLLVVA
jgi:hypothetical protein